MFNYGISDMTEDKVSNDEEDMLPINLIKDRGNQFATLKAALEDREKDVSDISALKETVTKMKTELKMAKRESNLINKLSFARKVTEQRMSTVISGNSAMEEDELVSLYSSLVDEEEFELNDCEEISARGDFLHAVESNISWENQEEGHNKLQSVKNKILERVKDKKLKRKERRLSIKSSVGSSGSQKTMNNYFAGGNNSRQRNLC